MKSDDKENKPFIQNVSRRCIELGNHLIGRQNYYTQALGCTSLQDTVLISISDPAQQRLPTNLHLVPIQNFNTKYGFKNRPSSKMTELHLRGQKLRSNHSLMRPKKCFTLRVSRVC